MKMIARIGRAIVQQATTGRFEFFSESKATWVGEAPAGPDLAHHLPSTPGTKRRMDHLKAYYAGQVTGRDKYGADVYDDNSVSPFAENGV